MIDRHVPPHHLRLSAREDQYKVEDYVCKNGSHDDGKGDVSAGAVSDGGANLSVINLSTFNQFYTLPGSMDVLVYRFAFPLLGSGCMYDFQRYKKGEKGGKGVERSHDEWRRVRRGCGDELCGL